MKKLILLNLILLMPFLAFSQNQEVGLHLGTAIYRGDLVYNEWSLAGAGVVGGAVYKRHMEPNFTLRGEVNVGQFSGADENFADENNNRGFSFETTFYDIALGAEWRFIASDRYDAAGLFKKTFTPYVTASFGIIGVDNTPVASGRILLDPADEEYRNPMFFTPVGAGLRYEASPQLTIELEFTTRFVYADYLDGFSKSANSSNQDVLFFGGVHLNYTMYNIKR